MRSFWSWFASSTKRSFSRTSGEVSGEFFMVDQLEYLGRRYRLIWCTHDHFVSRQTLRVMSRVVVFVSPCANSLRSTPARTVYGNGLGFLGDWSLFGVNLNSDRRPWRRDALGGKTPR